MINEFVILLSMGLTAMTIIPAIVVIYLFRKPLIDSLSAHDRSAVNWIVIGIVVNFSGGVLDNLWWAFAWSGDYINHTSAFRAFFFDHGSYSNVVFRQGAGIVAALCHIKSAQTADKGVVKKVSILSAALGVCFVVILIYVKFHI